MKHFYKKSAAVLAAGILSVGSMGAATVPASEAAHTDPKSETTMLTASSGSIVTDMFAGLLGSGDSSHDDITSVGKFTTTDLDGEEVTEKIFSDYDLTMVNAFATWCSPCVQELPYLQELSEKMKDKKVQIVGAILDTSAENGEDAQAEAIETAKKLREKAGITYPLLIPDEGNMNGRLANIQAVPETFFVDKDGNIVGETYSGSRSLEDWETIVEKELKALQENTETQTPKEND